MELANIRSYLENIRGSAKLGLEYMLCDLADEVRFSLVAESNGEGSNAGIIPT
jgi:hypothetical protein